MIIDKQSGRKGQNMDNLMPYRVLQTLEDLIIR